MTNSTSKYKTTFDSPDLKTITDVENYVQNTFPQAKVSTIDPVLETAWSLYMTVCKARRIRRVEVYKELVEIDQALSKETCEQEASRYFMASENNTVDFTFRFYLKIVREQDTVKQKGLEEKAEISRTMDLESVKQWNCVVENWAARSRYIAQLKGQIGAGDTPGVGPPDISQSPPSRLPRDYTIYASPHNPSGIKPSFHQLIQPLKSEQSSDPGSFVEIVATHAIEVAVLEAQIKKLESIVVEMSTEPSNSAILQAAVIKLKDRLDDKTRDLGLTHRELATEHTKNKSELPRLAPTTATKETANFNTQLISKDQKLQEFEDCHKEGKEQIIKESTKDSLIEKLQDELAHIKDQRSSTEQIKEAFVNLIYQQKFTSNIANADCGDEHYLREEVKVLEKMNSEKGRLLEATSMMLLRAGERIDRKDREISALRRELRRRGNALKAWDVTVEPFLLQFSHVEEGRFDVKNATSTFPGQEDSSKDGCLAK